MTKPRLLGKRVPKSGKWKRLKDIVLPDMRLRPHYTHYGDSRLNQKDNGSTVLTSTNEFK